MSKWINYKENNTYDNIDYESSFDKLFSADIYKYIIIKESIW